jgi:hypothetical protein
MLFHTASKVLTRLFLIRSASLHGMCNVVLVENRLLLGPGLGLQLQKTLRGGSQFTGRGLIAPSHGIGIDVKNENVEREERGVSRSRDIATRKGKLFRVTPSSIATCRVSENIGNKLAFSLSID